MYFNAEELTCRAEVGDLIFHREFRLYLASSIGGDLQIRLGEIVDLQNYQNAIIGEIEIGIA